MLSMDYVDHVQEWIEKKYPDLLSKMTFIKEIGYEWNLWSWSGGVFLHCT